MNRGGNIISDSPLDRVLLHFGSTMIKLDCPGCRARNSASPERIAIMRGKGRDTPERSLRDSCALPYKTLLQFWLYLIAFSSDQCLRLLPQKEYQSFPLDYINPYPHKHAFLGSRDFKYQGIHQSWMLITHTSSMFFPSFPLFNLVLSQNGLYLFSGHFRHLWNCK